MANGLTITERHRALWAKADPLTHPAVDPADGKFSPRAYHRRPRTKAEPGEPVEEVAPEMTQAVR